MPNTTNIVHVRFGGHRIVYAEPAYQYNYGQILKFDDLDLPEAYEVHFSNTDMGGVAVTQIGNADGVKIPYSVFLSGQTIYAWIFLHAGLDDGETVYKAVIPIAKRSVVMDPSPTPEDVDVISQAIAALDLAVEHADADVEAAVAAATLSESYAVGGTNTREGEDTDNSKYYKEQAELAKQAAEDAKRDAVDAKEKAEDAQEKAEDAQDAAETAQEAAELAQEKAEDAQEAAEGFADDASTSADRAEQAAKDAGYMFFYIDQNGDLIYQRTSNVQVDFYLHEGDLYVKAVG